MMKLACHQRMLNFLLLLIKSYAKESAVIVIGPICGRQLWSEVVNAGDEEAGVEMTNV